MKRSRKEGKTLFLCEECGLGYADRETAQKCEDWCKKTGTYPLEIARAQQSSGFFCSRH